MKRPPVPFAVPKMIDPDLARIRAYWESLKRGGNEMPFWDDVKLSSLPDLNDRLILVDVFAHPQRFRLNFVGQELISQYGESMTSNFIDEMQPKYPLEYLAPQCCVTVENSGATFYALDARRTDKSPGRAGYSRLLLPMWGNGHIGMLIGAFQWH